MSQLTGRPLGSRYALGQLIGAGGCCDVWRARDVVLDRPVAVKLLRPGYAWHRETLLRFRNEARLAGRLTHVNVAMTYDFCEHDPAVPPFLVMELIDGPSLAQVLAGGPLAPADTLDVVAQAAAGLQAAHDAGLVHRDIKPANLMLQDGRTVKITDFGISRALSAAPVTGTGPVIGTPHYLPPERAAGERGSPAGDLYALGVVGYECLAGSVPFTGTPLEVALAHRGRPLPPLPPSVPAEVAGFIAWLTARDPAARPASADLARQRAAELRDRLGAAPRGVGLPGASATAPPVTAVMPALPRPAPRRRGRRGRLALAAAAGTVAVVAAAVTAVAVTGSTAPAARPAAAAPAARPAAAAPTARASAPAIRLAWVSRAALIGEPAWQAASQLHQQGFRVRVTWRLAPRQPAGDVLAVHPAGLQRPGTLITLVAAYGRHSPGNGDGHGHGNGDSHGRGHSGNGDG